MLFSALHRRERLILRLESTVTLPLSVACDVARRVALDFSASAPFPLFLFLRFQPLARMYFFRILLATHRFLALAISFSTSRLNLESSRSKSSSMLGADSTTEPPLFLIGVDECSAVPSSSSSSSFSCSKNQRRRFSFSSRWSIPD